MSKLRPYLDGWLVAFLVPLVAAQTIVASGTFTFYSYMLPWVLAAAATVVIATGIPLLEFAAVFERPGPAKAGYWTGMSFLLVLECLAQYFKSQASFLPLVSQHIAEPSGVDLATFASLPIGRALPIAYIAALSFVVVGLGYAVARRVRIIRVMVAQKEHEQSELATARAEFARERERLAADLQTHANHIGQLMDELTRIRARLAEREKVIAGLKDEILRHANEPATTIPTRAAVIEYVRGRLAAGASLLSVARELDIKESTLRGWLDAIPANGHGYADRDEPYFKGGQG